MALPSSVCVPCREDICRLKRLQRDAFEQMLRLDTRLERLEERAGTSSAESSSGVSALFGSTQSSLRALGAAERAPIQASGQLVYGAAVPLHVRPLLYPPAVMKLKKVLLFCLSGHFAALPGFPFHKPCKFM